MPARRSRKKTSIATLGADLALAVPQVVAHRLTRMALAGPALSARDRKEFELMAAEKTAAFSQSWNAMAAETLLANQRIATSLMKSAWGPWLGGSTAPATLATEWQRAALGILRAGMEPVHRKAVANAKRLAGTTIV